MGVLKMFSSCFDCSNQQTPKNTGNPNPANFKILQHKEIGRFIVLRVKYPDCLNYEGEKILVFENISIKEIKNLNLIDPHFCASTHPSPVARFVPTLQGWEYAICFCEKA